MWLKVIETQSSDQILEQFLKNNEGLVVIDTLEWYLPAQKRSLNCRIVEGRPLNFIEEMIFQILNENEPIFQTKEAISNILNIDDVFLDVHLNQLQAKNIITCQDLSYHINFDMIQPNNEVSVEEIYEYKLDYMIESEFNTIYPTDLSMEEAKTNIPFRYSHSLTKIGADYFAWSDNKVEYASTLIKQLDPQSKAILTKIKHENIHEQLVDSNCSLPFFEFWVFDANKNQVYCRVWDIIQERYRPDLEQFLNEKETKNRIQQTLIYSSSKVDVMKKAKNIKTSKKTKDNDAAQHSAPILLRGKDIRTTFLQTFKDAKTRILLISPWISEQVIDKHLLNLFQVAANKGVTIHIGWGIANKRSDETRMPSSKLLNTMTKIKDIQGRQAVFVHWIGNHHTKEIVVDQEYHLLGSFNWLSYRGDYQLRNESVYQVYDTTVINKSIKHIESEIIRSIQINDSINSNEYSILGIVRELTLLQSNRDNRLKHITQILEQLTKSDNSDVITKIKHIVMPTDLYADLKPKILQLIDINKE